MSSKLIINRYEVGKETLSMEITLHEETICNQLKTKTFYGPWSNGENIPNVREPKLIVNVLDLNKKSDMDLDSVAKHVLFHHSPSKLHNNDTFNGNNIYNLRRRTDSKILPDADGKRNNSSSLERKSKSKIDEISDFLSKKAETSDGRSFGDIQTLFSPERSDPLDQKLERIRKNNEKIMENILILNKTLHYTRKKEIEESMSARLAQVTFVCDKCGKAFSKNSSFQYHMRQHKTKYENNGKDLHLTSMSKIIKPWVCPYCFQVWPEESLLQNHLNKSSCLISMGSVDDFTINGILQHAQKSHVAFLIQCEFCQKLFSSIPKAHKHQKGHQTDKNYECSECNMTFRSFESATRHWGQECQWLKKNYNFTLYKCFACNICYEKFDNLNNLYNHRYEYEHFFLKCSDKDQIEKNGENASENPTGKEETALGETSDDPLQLRDTTFLVHQCELCGYICKHISILLLHKEEGHSTLLCQVCGEISEERMAFVNHMKKHTAAELENRGIH